MQDNIYIFLDQTIGFVEGFRKLKSTYDIYVNNIKELDKATQDILHKFELDTIPSNEKCKLATQLSNIRKDRRYYKDKAETLKLMLEAIDEAENKSNQFISNINKLGNLAGIVRKKYANKNSRLYTPRFIKDMVINSQKNEGKD